MVIMTEEELNYILDDKGFRFGVISFGFSK